MVKYDKDTQKLIDEAARLYHLLGDLAGVTSKVEILLSAAVLRLPPGSMAGYFAATTEVKCPKEAEGESEEGTTEATGRRGEDEGVAGG